MKIAFITLGCKTNQYESEKMAQILSKKGFDVCFGFESADVYVLNTCSVTAEADKKSRQMITKINTINPSAKIIVCGCSSQNNALQFEGKKNVVFVCGTDNKFKTVDYICDNFTPNNTTTGVDLKTRKYLKIQDGCNNFCTYCIIPYLRGREKSRSIDEIVAEAKQLDKFFSEIVLTGINMSAFGRDNNQTLAKLISSLSSVNARIRIGSLEARVIDDEFLTACKNLKNFCPHFHLSMQSGSDDVLKQMNRHYTKDEFIEKVALIRKYFKNPFIACDIIVGFPTETDENFKQTIETISKINFSFMHIFPYSKREGTVASKFKPLPPDVIKSRLQIIAKINDDNYKNYIHGMLGEEVEVLIEKVEGKFAVGFCKRYVKCYFEGTASVGEVLKLKATKIFKDGLLVSKI